MKYFSFIIFFIFPIISTYAQYTDKGNNQYEELDSSPESTNLLSQNFISWGIEAGTSIDVSDKTLTTCDVDAYVGYHNSIIPILGVGVGGHSSLSSRRLSIPLYAIMRINFIKNSSLCFIDGRAGFSFNNLERDYSQGGFYAGIGLGYNLVTFNHFKLVAVLGYSFYQLKPYGLGNNYKDVHSSNMTSIKFGIQM